MKTLRRIGNWWEWFWIGSTLEAKRRYLEHEVTRYGGRTIWGPQ